MQTTLDEARGQMRAVKDAKRARAEENIKRSSQTQKAANILNLSTNELASFLSTDEEVCLSV